MRTSLQYLLSLSLLCLFSASANPDPPFTLNYPVNAENVTWITTGDLNLARSLHTTTLLANGKVLVTGGVDASIVPTNKTELYDPATGVWTNTGDLNFSRFAHTATLLPNGKVLVVGGADINYLNKAELYDPATRVWTTTGDLIFAHYQHTATLLSDGKVLVAGGVGSSGYLNKAELYDPAAGTWSRTGDLNFDRTYHTATLLANGKVLVAGGFRFAEYLNKAELYDPATGSWSNTGDLNFARPHYTATLLSNGKVLVAGGFGNIGGTGILNKAELYDPATGVWSNTGDLHFARFSHTATLLPNGKVLVAGGSDGSSPLNKGELYDPATGLWSTTADLNFGRVYGTATLIANGRLLVAGGRSSDRGSDNEFIPTKKAELYDLAVGSWSNTGNLNFSSFRHTATLLPNGKVLVAGGNVSNFFTNLDRAELYDPATATWSTTGDLNFPRGSHTATLLLTGKVLVAGGNDSTGQLTRAEIYDPVTGIWRTTGSLNFARRFHTATLLRNGQVLVAGGQDSNFLTTGTAELYDPFTGVWSLTGTLNFARDVHTATLLPNGKVLVVGGNSAAGAISQAELYDPATGNWSITASLNFPPRYHHTATLLPNGKVLVAGGDFRDDSLTRADLYNPATGGWEITGNLNFRRSLHTATLLPNGKVLIVGGNDQSGPGRSVVEAELYEPATGSWSIEQNVNFARVFHTATLLPNGDVLVSGGFGLNKAEVFDVGLGFDSAWQPVLKSATSPLLISNNLVVTGSRFKGVSEASGGNFQNSSSNYPLVQLLSLVNEQTVFLLSDSNTNWSDTLFTSQPVTSFPLGYSLVTVFTNGIPSQSLIIPLVGVVAAAGGTLVNESCSPNGQIDPGERVTVHLKLMNNGNASTTNLTATLQSGGGVVAPSGAQTYGAISSGNMTGRDFSFTADPALTSGQPITATLQLQDGATNLGTVSFNFTAGPSPCGGIRLVVTSTPLQRSGGVVTTMVTVQNIGILPADHVTITSAMLGSTNGIVVPSNLGTINVGGSASAEASFTTAATGASLLKFSGTYGPGVGGSGSFGSTKRVTIP